MKERINNMKVSVDLTREELINIIIACTFAIQNHNKQEDWLVLRDKMKEILFGLDSRF